MSRATYSKLVLLIPFLSAAPSTAQENFSTFRIGFGGNVAINSTTFIEPISGLPQTLVPSETCAHSPGITSVNGIPTANYTELFKTISEQFFFSGPDLHVTCGSKTFLARAVLESNFDGQEWTVVEQPRRSVLNLLMKSRLYALLASDITIGVYADNTVVLLDSQGFEVVTVGHNGSGYFSNFHIFPDELSVSRVDLAGLKYQVSATFEQNDSDEIIGFTIKTSLTLPEVVLSEVENIAQATVELVDCCIGEW